MRNLSFNSYSSISAALLISIFMYTALTKLIGYNSFNEAISNQPLAPYIKQHLLWAIPTTLFLSALLLFSEKFRLYGYTFSCFLLSAFSVYVALVLAHFFPYIPCSCAGIAESISWKQHLIINLLLLSVAITGFYLELKKKINVNPKP